MSKRKLFAAMGILVVVGVAAMLMLGRSANYITIGTGGITGVYYPAGGAMSKYINAQGDQYGIQMSVESTGGSVFNINAILSGNMEFGIAQCDKQYQALNGQAEWQDRGPQKDLRFVCSLHHELVTLVAAEDAGIRSIKDLRGKVVSIGNFGSGQRGNAIDILTTVGIDWQKDMTAQGLKASEQSSMLQDGLIDAFFYTVGHPSGAIKEATAGLQRRVRFVPITGMDALLEKHPYYTPGAIKKALYPQATNDDDVPTIGMLTTVLTSASVPDEIVYAVTRTLFENLADFRAKHEAFSKLDAAKMAVDGQFAPYHPGALKYYREAKLVK
jgi:uncharacterized protein